MRGLLPPSLVFRGPDRGYPVSIIDPQGAFAPKERIEIILKN